MEHIYGKLLYREIESKRMVFLVKRVEIVTETLARISDVTNAQRTLCNAQLVEDLKLLLST